MPLPIYEEKTDRPLSGIRHVIAVAAGKGGVGKSTVAINLALQLRAKGHRVGILDADLYGPSVPKMLPVDKRPGKRGNMLLPAESHGIKVMSMAYFRREGEAAAVRAPVANSIIGQFIEQIEWGDLEYLIVDFPPGTGDVQITLAQKIAFTGAVMVTMPQQVSVIDVRKAIDLFRQVHIPILGIVENMSYFEEGGSRSYPFGKGGGAALAAVERVPLLAEIPLDPAVSQACDAGEPLCADAPSYPSFARLSDRVTTTINNSIDAPLAVAIEGSVLQIIWEDQQKQRIPLDQLQRHCPCAACQSTPPVVDPHVGAVDIDHVGRYAVRIAFDSGCSSGIFELADLRSMGGFHA
ncbi:MAG: P-loop NTPase [Chlamydiales bacterium]|nr:P-loop NTPase [Chlamydiales bacterium]